MLEGKSFQKVSRFGTEIKDAKNIKDFIKLLNNFTTNDIFNKKDLLNWFGEVYKTGLVTPNTKKAPLSMEKIKKDANRRFSYLIQNLVVEETQTVGEYKITDSGRKILLGDPRGYFEIAQRRPVLRMAIEILTELQKFDPIEAYLTKKDLTLVEASLPFYKCKELLPDILLLHKSQNPHKDFKKILSKPNPTLYPMQTDSRSGCEIKNISDYGDTSFRMLRLTGVIKEVSEKLVLNPEKQDWIQELLDKEILIEKYIPTKKPRVIFKPLSKDLYVSATTTTGEKILIKKSSDSERLGESPRKNSRSAIEASKKKNGDTGETLLMLEERALGNDPVQTSADYEGKEDVFSNGKKYEVKTVSGPISSINISSSQLKRLQKEELDYFVIYSNKLRDKTSISSSEFNELCEAGLIQLMYTNVELVFDEACTEYLETHTVEVDESLRQQAIEEVENGLQ